MFRVRIHGSANKAGVGGFSVEGAVLVGVGFRVSDFEASGEGS